MHLPHLALAQVFDALSFYLDNQPEINEYIERNRVSEELIHPKEHQLDRRAFLKLPVAQRNALLSHQAGIVAEHFQPGAEGMEWTDEYIEDESMDDE